MGNYWDIFVNGYTGYFHYLVSELTFQTSPWWKNYFLCLLLVSAFFFVLELASPWRPKQPKFRKDFWLDFFYMFFNFFIFSLVIYNAASSVVVDIFNSSIVALTSFDLQAYNPMQHWSYWAVLLTGFVLRDFIQWNVHRLLHRSEWLWEYHKVHHSVEQMGFAAHLRYHWMENIVYRVIEYIPLALMGIGLHDYFIIHIFTLIVGHYNHANIRIPEWIKGLVFGFLIGIIVLFSISISTMLSSVLILLASIILGLAASPILKYIFNSPEMHIWHHAYELPESHPTGINFAITLSIWDYLFKTNHIPHDGANIRLGFSGMEDYPDDFGHHLVQGFVPLAKNDALENHLVDDYKTQNPK